MRKSSDMVAAWKRKGVPLRLCSVCANTVPDAFNICPICGGGAKNAEEFADFLTAFAADLARGLA